MLFTCGMLKSTGQLRFSKYKKENLLIYNINTLILFSGLDELVKCQENER